MDGDKGDIIEDIWCVDVDELQSSYELYKSVAYEIIENLRNINTNNDMISESLTLGIFGATCCSNYCRTQSLYKKYNSKENKNSENKKDLSYALYDVYEKIKENLYSEVIDYEFFFENSGT